MSKPWPACRSDRASDSATRRSSWRVASTPATGLPSPKPPTWRRWITTPLASLGRAWSSLAIRHDRSHGRRCPCASSVTRRPSPISPFSAAWTCSSAATGWCEFLLPCLKSLPALPIPVPRLASRQRRRSAPSLPGLKGQTRISRTPTLLKVSCQVLPVSCV